MKKWMRKKADADKTVKTVFRTRAARGVLAVLLLTLFLLGYGMTASVINSCRAASLLPLPPSLPGTPTRVNDSFCTCAGVTPPPTNCDWKALPYSESMTVMKGMELALRLELEAAAT